MSGNELKTPIPFTAPLFARTAAQNEDRKSAQGLPCHVVKVESSGIVTVAFDVNEPPYTFQTITVPVQTSVYERIPIQVGDKGWAVPADVYLGGVTDLGGGTADLTRRGNLTSLAFQPLGNAKWSAVDLNSYVLNGPNGVTLEDTGGVNRLVLTPAGMSITITVGGITITIPSGQTLTINGNVVVNGTITATGDITAGEGGIDQVRLQTHTHEDPQGGNTGAPNAGT
jgi:hypothetical protein